MAPVIPLFLCFAYCLKVVGKRKFFTAPVIPFSVLRLLRGPDELSMRRFFSLAVRVRDNSQV